MDAVLAGLPRGRFPKTLLQIAAGVTLITGVYAQEYGGPSILSRGMSPSVNSHADIQFRPYVTLEGICDTGLTAARVESSGKFTNSATCGVQVSAGVYGYHSWKRTVVGLNYMGNYQHYPAIPYYDGTDQVLALTVSRQLSKRTNVSLATEAGTFARRFWRPDVGGPVDTLLLQVPTTQLFDNRIYYMATMANMTTRLTPRWSFNIGAQGFLTRYRSTSLIGLEGGAVMADVAYRYSRFGTVGFSYGFEHYGYTRGFGASDLHMLGVIYSLRLSRSWELALQGGAARVESLGLEAVATDPLIAAITGQSFGIVAAYHLNYVPNYNASLTHNFRRGELSFRYGRMITPGNGVYLTSGQESGWVSYTYTGLQHWHVAGQGGYLRMTGLMQTLPAYGSYTAGFGVTRDIARSLHLIFNVDYMRWDAGPSILQRNDYRGTLGIGWSPGDIPLSFR